MNQPARTSPTSEHRAPGTGRWLRIVVLGTVAAAITIAAVLWWPTRASTPDELSAEAGFARDMQTHHAQAVQMAFLVRDKTTDPALRSITYDIITSQQQQAGQMYAWLGQWDLPQTGTQPPMQWMRTGSHHSTSTTGGTSAMPGLASAQQIAGLEAATGLDAEKRFLQLMIAHHRGGVDMARAVLKVTAHAQVRQLATAIATAQVAEIDQLQKLLDERTARGRG